MDGERVLPLTQAATTSQTRGQATHIALMCDDASAQPHLPQVLVGTPDLLPAGVARDLQDSLAPNVYLLRLKSRWTDTVLLSAVLRTLGKSIREFFQQKVPVLLLDAAPSHLDDSLPRLAASLGIHLV